MNTLRIMKGKDVTIYVDQMVLCFVTDFVAKESKSAYRIEEFLADRPVDSVNTETQYVINITALSYSDSSVFNKESFTLRVIEGNETYEYFDCFLKEKHRVIESSKPVVVKYTIVASDMRITEVANELG